MSLKYVIAMLNFGGEIASWFTLHEITKTSVGNLSRIITQTPGGYFD